ncbi:MAG: Ig-like domain-containing protein [Fibrobacteres bacterium]|nr:Ig-like domain-containing protein [Fibrobacterota bacterium]
MKIFSLAVILLTTVLFGDAIDDLKPGCWLEIPNSKLYDVRAPQDSFANALCGGIEGISGIINDWCSGAFDTKRSRLLIGPGGGHNGYSGNEVYAFDLFTLKWSRITNPQPLVSCSSERPNPDSFPGAMHTYDGLEYMPPPIDRYAVVDMWGGYPVRTFYSMDMNTMTWTAHRAMPAVQRTGDVSAYDTLTRRFFFGSAYGGQFVEWDPVADTCLRKIWAGATYYQNAFVEPKRRLLMSIGNKAAIHAIPIVAAPGAMTDRTISPAGFKALERAVSPGCEYDAVSDKVVGWAETDEIGRTDVVSLDLDHNYWTLHKASQKNSVTPGAENQWGTWGRWRYVPSRNVFVLYNDVRQNVFVFKFTSWRDTVKMDSIVCSAVSTTLEQYLSMNLNVSAFRTDHTIDTITNSCTYISLDTNLAVMEGSRMIAKNIGVARIQIRKSTAVDLEFDTIQIQIVTSTALADSIKISQSNISILAGESYQLKAIASYYHNNEFFTRSVEQAAEWTSTNTGAAVVRNGEVSAINGGTAKVICLLDGKKDTIDITVNPKPEFILRVNFSTHSNPFAYGWVSENAGVYTDTRGFGWVGPIVGSTARDDRAGSNYLLRSFISSNGSSYKVKVVDGEYIIKYAVGDNLYGGTDIVDYDNTVLLTHSGSSTEIAKDTVSVTGGKGLSLKITGKICYLVVMKKGVTDIDLVAWDVPPFIAPDTLLHVANEDKGIKTDKPLFVEASPNPFNPTVTLRLGGFDPSRAQYVKVELFDGRGRVLHSEIVSNSKIREGWQWNSNSARSGVILARIKVGNNQVISRKLLLVK